MRVYVNPNLYTLFITLALSGCEGCTCPPSVDLGTVAVKNRDFIPYQDGQRLTFVDTVGNSIILENTLDKTESIPLLQESICAKVPFSSSSYYYTDLTARSLVLKPTRYIPGLYDYAFRILYGVNNIQGPPTDTVFYDQFYATNSLDGGALTIIVNDRGNRARFPVNIIDLYQQYRLINDTVMNGIEYRNVYAPVTNPTFYYSSSSGIVAFKDKQQWWYLKP